MKPSISLCMITKNEEDLLPQCLVSVKDIVSEMIIVDTGSTDRTVSIAQQWGAKVIHTMWEDDFAQARNLGLDQATGTWILQLDADEVLPQEEGARLCELLRRVNGEGLYMKIQNVNKQGQLMYTTTSIRVFRNRREHRFKHPIHEQILSSIYQRQKDATILPTDIHMIHYGYSPECMRDRDKVNRNIRILNKALDKSPKNSFFLYKLGVEYMNRGDYRRAVTQFEQSRATANHRDIFTHLIYNHEGKAHYIRKDYQQAVKIFSEGLKYFPTYTDLYHYHSLSSPCS